MEMKNQEFREAKKISQKLASFVCPSDVRRQGKKVCINNCFPMSSMLKSFGKW